MTHDELRDYLDKFDAAGMIDFSAIKAIRAVVELHKPVPCNKTDTNEVISECGVCKEWPSYSCNVAYPCSTIQVIEAAFK